MASDKRQKCVKQESIRRIWEVKPGKVFESTDEPHYAEIGWNGLPTCVLFSERLVQL